MQKIGYLNEYPLFFLRNKKETFFTNCLVPNFNNILREAFKNREGLNWAKYLTDLGDKIH